MSESAAIINYANDDATSIYVARRLTNRTPRDAGCPSNIAKGIFEVRLLGQRKPDLVTVEGWRAIDAHELERGRGEQRPRVKLAGHDDLLAAARPRGSAAARS